MVFTVLYVPYMQPCGAFPTSHVASVSHTVHYYLHVYYLTRGLVIKQPLTDKVLCPDNGLQGQGATIELIVDDVLVASQIVLD